MEVPDRHGFAPNNRKLVKKAQGRILLMWNLVKHNTRFISVLLFNDMSRIFILFCFVFFSFSLLLWLWSFWGLKISLLVAAVILWVSKAGGPRAQPIRSTSIKKRIVPGAGEHVLALAEKLSNE